MNIISIKLRVNPNVLSSYPSARACPKCGKCTGYITTSGYWLCRSCGYKEDWGSGG